MAKLWKLRLFVSDKKTFRSKYKKRSLNRGSFVVYSSASAVGVSSWNSFWYGSQSMLSFSA